MSAYDSDSTKKSPGRTELDDFWDIDRLIPDRPARRPAPVPRPTPTAVDIEVPPRPSSEAGVTSASLTVPPTGETHYVPPHSADEGKDNAPLLDYRPDGVLIHRVQVFEWHAGFHYFDQFAKDAADYDRAPPPAAAAPVGFFSYFPQYAQLNRRRADWYLFWREQVRQGQFPSTDYAYVLLYIFELINLAAPDEPTARRHRDALAAVWMAYRRTYPQLDHYMCEWLCDYCLIHRLPAPPNILAPALDAIIEESRLKEFYLVSVIRTPDGRADRALATARILLRHCCQYDYRKSKFAQGEHKALFDKTIPAAVASALPLLLGAEGHPPAITMLDSTVTRDAYTGALCSYQNKRRITVDYTSFSRSHELRFLIGDMVKHVENRLRSWIGVRSRLSVMSLPIPLRDALDAYLAPIAPPKIPSVTKKKEVERPAYEALYDLPPKPLSSADAARIEQSSWETTRILTEAFDGGTFDVETAPPPPIAAPTPTIPPEPIAPAPAPVSPAASSETGSLLGSLTPFLVAALAGDHAAQKATAATLRKMPDAVADEINAITAEGDIGDIILEDDGTGFYAVIEDYREDVTAWLSKN